MDVIDLDFIGNPENPYGYWISSDLAKKFSYCHTQRTTCRRIRMG